MPRFSVILPCFNSTETLRAAIDTVRAQTYPKWELLCWDDGSTDETPKIISAAAAADPRIKYYCQSNSGPAVARNRAAEAAVGDILAFLDADDLWVPTKLERLNLIFHRHQSPDAVYSQVGFFRTDPGLIGAVSTVIDRDLRIRDLIGENPVCTMSNVAVTARAWRSSGGIDPEMVHAEDLDWLIRLVGAGARVRPVKQVLTLYRANEAGLSANLRAMHRGWSRAVKTAQLLDPSISGGTVARAEALHLRYLARRALRTGQSANLALGLALRGVSRSPAGFFAPPRRGVAVLAASLAAPFMPAFLKRLSFQE